MIYPILFAILAQLPAHGDQRATEPPKAIYRVWIHSVEEDKGGVEVYRPEDFRFPPARGREGFEVKARGDFVAHEIAPGDGTDKIPGRWTCRQRDVLSVTCPDVKPKEFLPGEVIPPLALMTIRIVSCDENVLRVKIERR
jgi:hypothetical protein